MTTNIAISNCAGATLPAGKIDQLPNTTIIRAGVTGIDNFGDVNNTTVVSGSVKVGTTLAVTGTLGATPTAPWGAFCTVQELIWAVRMAVEGRTYGDPTTTPATRGTFTARVNQPVIADDPDAFGGVSSAIGWTGWTLYDTFPIAGDGDPSCITTQVFRALNKDGVSYKYAIFRWNLLLSEINITSCESWDKVTRTSTNETHTYFDSSPIPYKLNETKLVLLINPRWLVLQSIIFDEPSVWAGVFETAREDITDVATVSNPGLPCWGWISSTLWSLGAKSYLEKPMGSSATTNSDYTLISMPRTKSGATGFGAAKGWGADYGVAQYPNWLTTGASAAAFVSYLSNDTSVGNKFQANSWDTTKRLVLPIKPIHDYAANFVANYGTIFGLKVLAPIGPMMTKIKVNIDDDGNYTPVVTANNASTKIHWLLNTHHKASGGAVSSGADSNSWFQNTQLGITNISTAPYGKPAMLVNVGSWCYALASTIASPNLVKILRISLLDQSTTDITPAANGSYAFTTNLPANTGYPTQFFDIKYDGDQYVYVTHQTGVLRINVSTGTVDNRGGPTGGLQTIALTASKIYGVPSAASAAPIIYSWDRSTFVAAASSTNILLTDFGEAVTMVDACTGSDGSVYFTPVFTTWPVSGQVGALTNGYSTRYRLIKIDPAGVVSYHPFWIAKTAVVSQTATPMVATAALTSGLATYQSGLQVLDSNNILLWNATGLNYSGSQAATATEIFAVRINTTKMTKQTLSDYMLDSVSLFGTGTNTGVSTVYGGIIANRRIQFAKIQGVIIAAPFYSTIIGTYATLQLCSQSTTPTLGKMTAVGSTQATGGLNGVVNITDPANNFGNNLFYWDGVRFYGNTDNSLHIFSKLNNESCYSDGSKNILLGQITLPA